MSRRHLLKALGVGSATAVVAGTGVLSYRVLDTKVLDPGSGQAYEPWHEWRKNPGPLGAVAAAILAASPHNTQPWIFAVTAGAIDVFVDGDRNLGAVDPFRREQHVGLGCALENLDLGCQARGLQPVFDLLPDGADAPRIAHVSLQPASPLAQPNLLYDAIGRRHTDRGPYTEQSLSAAVLAGLVDADGLPGVAVQWIDDAEGKRGLGDLMVEAATEFSRDRQQSADAFAWFRPDNDAVQRHRDGATLDAQGLSPLTLSVGKLLPAESRAAGDAFWIKQTRTVHTATAAAYGVLTAPDPDDRRTQLVAGRLLERIHLTAISQAIALQHMNQITERIDAERVGGTAATFADRLAGLLPPGGRPLVAFRVGYPTHDARPSPRRAVEAVVR